MTDPLAIAEALLSLPTVPFLEDLTAGFCVDFAAERGLDASRDAAGNVLVKSGTADGVPPLVLVAHLDHPGFVVTSVDAGEVSLEFRGGVRPVGDIAGTPVDVFRPGQVDRAGRARLTAAELRPDGSLTSATAELLEGEAGTGDLAMWGFPGWSIDEGRITVRVCDDLLGVAAILACLDRVPEPAVPVWGLFTRAEEDGLLGAFEAARLRTVPSNASVVSLECSKALPEAPQGAGVIVRVGDRMSVFDNGLTEALRAAAERAGVSYRRKLMDGGVCEATVFSALGYRASGLAVPLGNYHNAADAGEGIAPETVLVDDWLAEVELLVSLATSGLPPTLDGLPENLASRAARARELLGADDA